MCYSATDCPHSTQPGLFDDVPQLKLLSIGRWLNDDYIFFLLTYFYLIIIVQVVCLKISLYVTVCTVTTTGSYSFNFRFKYSLLSPHSRHPWLFYNASQLVLQVNRCLSIFIPHGLTNFNDWGDFDLVSYIWLYVYELIQD